MTFNDFDELFAYDLWASNRLLDAAASSGEAWIADRGHGAGSTRDMVVHVADAQLLWLARLRGEVVKRAPVERYDRIDEVRAHCTASSAALLGHLRGLGDPALAGRTPEYNNAQGQPETMPIYRILLQLFTHGVHHRAEASELLTAAGSAPAQLDIIAYWREQG